MLARYIPRGHVLKTVSKGTENNRGEGIRMAVDIGAATADQFDGAHVEPCDPRSDKTEPAIFSWYFGILVNRQGDRFMDESCHTTDIQFDMVGNTIHREQDGLAYAITDAGTRRAVSYLDDFNWTDQSPIVAGSLDELAELL
jgi:tricarballylate dehydrogenase